MILFQLALARLSFRNGCCATCMGWSKTRVLVWKDCQFRGWDIFLEGWLSDSIRNFTITLVKFDQWSNTGYSAGWLLVSKLFPSIQNKYAKHQAGDPSMFAASMVAVFGWCCWNGKFRCNLLVSCGILVLYWFCQRVLFPIFGASPECSHPLGPRGFSVVPPVWWRSRHWSWWWISHLNLTLPYLTYGYPMAILWLSDLDAVAAGPKAGPWPRKRCAHRRRVDLAPGRPSEPQVIAGMQMDVNNPLKMYL